MTLYQKKYIKLPICPRNVFIVTMLLVIAIVALLFIFRAFFYNVINLPSEKNAFLSCETTHDSTDRYNCYKDVALSSLQKDKSVSMLSQNALEFHQYNKTHLMGHAIARAALIVSNYNLESTAEKCLPNCITGYWHGIAEEWGKHAPERIEEYVDFLAKLCSSTESAGVDCSGHSMGHFYMSENKNLTESFALCDLTGSILFPECMLGVMHQYRIDGGAKDVFAICESHAGRIQKACYKTSSFLYPRWEGILSITDRLALCKELNSKIPVEFNRCYDGIGDLLLGNRETPPLEKCESLNDNFVQLCKKGLRSPNPFASFCRLGSEPAIACGQ